MKKATMTETLAASAVETYPGTYAFSGRGEKDAERLFLRRNAEHCDETFFISLSRADAPRRHVRDGRSASERCYAKQVHGTPLRIAALFLFALLLTLLGPLAARAQEAGAFARIGFGAQGVGVGNALVADLSGDTSPYHNPALAPFASRQNLAASAAFLSFDRQLQYLQFAAPLKPSAGIAVGLTHLSVSDIEGRDASGYRTEDLSVDEYAFFLAFGTRAGERLSLGAALKVYRADYLDTFDPAVTFGLDLGLTARLTEHLSLGLAAADLLAGYEWESGDGATTTDRFPARLRLGGHYRFLDGKARMGAEVEAQLTARETLGGGSASTRRVFFRVGGAYQIAGPLTLRAGLDRIGGGAGTALRPGAGFTISQDVGQLPLEASYAFARETKAGGAMHLVTLRLFL